MRIRGTPRTLSANLSTLFANGEGSRYDSRVGKTVYKIEEFPDDDRLWRIEWIGGVRYNATVPSDPLMDICLTRLPPGETNPLSARARSSEAKFHAGIVDNHKPTRSPANCVPWNKSKKSRHAMSSGGAVQILLIITNIAHSRIASSRSRLICELTPAQGDQE